MFHHDFLAYLEDEIDARSSSQKLYKEKGIILPHVVIFRSVQNSYCERYVEPLTISYFPGEISEYCSDMIDYLFASMAQIHELPGIYYELRMLTLVVLGEYEKIIESIADAEENSQIAMIDWISRYEAVVEASGCILPTK
jgi:hypothetical protein